MPPNSLPPVHEPRTGPLGALGTASPRRPTETRLAAEGQRDRHQVARRRWDRLFLLVLLLVLVVVAVPTVLWHLTTPRAVGIVVVSKTVPRQRWMEHAGLFWWLDHTRRVRPDGQPFELRRDYLGWDPVARRGGMLDDARLAKARLVYLADSYGVYAADLDDDQRAPDPSRLIYGGVTLDEAAAIARFRARGGAVVAEFNTLESPTSGTPAEAVLTGVLGARYERWLGRWYRDLASEDEIPPWMRERWRRRTGTEWKFRGEGLVFHGEIDDRLLVLPSARFAGAEPVTLHVDRPGDPLVADVRDGIAWWYWMAGVTATDSGEVLASFALHLDAEGEAAMRAAGFPLRFPAIVRHRAAPLAAYLAGDFAELTIAPTWARTRGIDPLRAWTARGGLGDRGNAHEAFWNVTLPIWEAMAREAGI